MTWDRRQLLAAGATGAVLSHMPAAAAASGRETFGLIGRMKAQAGKRAELMEILAEGTGSMPGCLSYIIAEDATDPDAIWVTEVWDSEASHKASLQLPQVRSAIAKGRPLIAGMDSIAATRSARGTGLVGMTS
jgi:quinol monooxygenase YgiN